MVGNTPIVDEISPTCNVKLVYFTVNPSSSGAVDFSDYSKVQFIMAQTSGAAVRTDYLMVSGGAYTAGYVVISGTTAATPVNGIAVVVE